VKPILSIYSIYDESKKPETLIVNANKFRTNLEKTGKNRGFLPFL
jgi:hypothetical protein